MNNYIEGFDSWKDVQDHYEMNEREPEEVIYAAYDGGSYEGYSTIIYRNGDFYYLEESSHCSCYGLEGQWNPEQYTIEAIVKIFDMRNSSWRSDALDKCLLNIRQRLQKDGV